MSQIIHILRKDVRQHWLLLGVTLAILVAYTWRESRTWSSQQIPFLDWLPALVSISWWFLILRVVQGESLVGDRQFWITRPYEWRSLLAAKVLFVVVFVSMPLLVVGIFLLIHAGFSPAPHLLRLLRMQLLLLVMPLLPFTALATVTRSIAQGLLAVLGIALYIAAISALSMVIDSEMPSTAASDWLQTGVFIGVSFLVVCLQFARRRTVMSRTLLVVCAALIFVIDLITPLFVQLDRDYPLPPAGSPPPFAASLAPENTASAKAALEEDQRVWLRVPIQVSGIAEGSLAKAQWVRLTLETAQVRWSSNWRRTYPLLLPGNHSWPQDFTIDRKTFDRLKTTPAKARVSVAATLFRDGSARRIEAGRRAFPIPDVGQCQILPGGSNLLRCRAPFARPTTVLLRTDLAASTCPRSDREAEPSNSKTTAYAWEWGQDSTDFGISPIKEFEFYFAIRDRDEKATAHICPGTPLSVSFPTQMESTRVEFEVPGFQLANYRIENPAFGGVVGITLPR